MNVTTSRRNTRGGSVLPLLALVLAAFILPPTASASFHLWEIRELYTNLDGSVQYIELFTTSSGQQSTNGISITVTEQSTSLTHVFTFPANTPSPTNNHALLIATSNLPSLGGPTPDFPLPANFLFSDASSIIFNGTVQGQINYTSLPTNGSSSLAIPSLTSQPNSPQNYAGTVGSVSVPEPASWSLLGMGGLGLGLFLRRRTGRPVLRM